MLRVLTYAYATGIFGSEEITRNCYEDEVLRAFCEKQAPRAITIKRFRRENRGLLKWCLTQLFKRAFRKQFGLEEAFIPAGVRRYLDHLAATRLNIARQMDRTEEP
jgi:transposase